MNEYKKAIIIFVIAIVFFGAGFGVGYWRSNQIGDSNYQDRIDELEQLNTELNTGYTELEQDYQESEERLTDFLKKQSDRNDKALEILEGAGEKASEATGSIGRAISGLDRLSEAIEILLNDN